MMLVISILAFIIAIGILVTVHEYGHYWVARKAGVKVLRFSVGFGKPLWKRTAGPDNTEYVLAMLPLGGYVRMLDEREGEIPDEHKKDIDRAFNRQNVWKRIAIVAAGPLANFLLAIIVYAMMYMVGLNGMRPVVGDTIENSPAAVAGFQAQDELLAINDEEVRSWKDARLVLLHESLDKEPLTITVKDIDGQTKQRILDLRETSLLKDQEKEDFIQKAGLKIWRPSIPVISEVLPDSAAEKAGLKAQDRILAFNGEKITDAHDWLSQIKNNPGQAMTVLVERDEGRLDIRITPVARTKDGKEEGFIGAGVGAVLTDAARERLQVRLQYGVFESFALGMKNTWDMSVLTLRLMGRMISGEVSLKNVSGPLTIGQVAGITAVQGFTVFLSFLGLVSLSLGILNLLPVPMLDGGHLLYYFIEVIKGSPVSEQVEMMGQRIGLALLGSLMVLAFYNDITRLFF